MRSKGMFKGPARGVCALLGAAAMFALPGCDMADGVVALVSKSAQGAIQDQADALVQDAIEGVLGNIIPSGE